MRKGWTVASEYIFVDDGISGTEFGEIFAYLFCAGLKGS